MLSNAKHVLSKTVNRVQVGQKMLLSGQELGDCIRIGIERNSQNRKSRTKNMNYSARNDEDISIQGVIGEFCFLKMFGLDMTPLFDTTCRNTKNDTFDAVLPNGYTVDVKTTVYNNASIMTPIWKKQNPPGCLALMIIERLRGFERNPFDSDEDYTVRFCGFVDSKTLFQKSNLKQMFQAKKWYYVMPQNTLVDYETMTSKN